MVRKNRLNLTDAEVQRAADQLRAALAPLREKREGRSAPIGADRAAGGDRDGDRCLTCGGTGRLRHPRTGKPSRQCPECDGTGFLAPEASDHAGGQYARHVRFQDGEVRVLNSARGGAADAAWARLVATALEIERGTEGAGHET